MNNNKNTISRKPIADDETQTLLFPKLASATCIALLTTLTACGGGGGSNTPPEEKTVSQVSQSDQPGADSVNLENGEEQFVTEQIVENAIEETQGETDSKAGADQQTSQASKPTGAQIFGRTIYPVVTENCTGCHADGPGSPLFAHPDEETAYRALLDNQKLSLSDPANSRVAIRLKEDKHFCWTDCDSDYTVMMTAIDQFMEFAGLYEIFGKPNPEKVLASSGVRLSDGVETKLARFEDNIIARYEFMSGEGDVALDSSNVAPALNLSLSGVEWVGGGGIKIVSGKAQGAAEASRKLYDRIADPVNGTQEFSVEAWITPTSTDQEGPARIVSYSLNTSARNFTLGQALYNYDFRLATQDANSNANGTPSLSTADADMDLQASLQHVVMTYDQLEGRRIYVNGQFTDDVDGLTPALLNWNPSYQFVLGNEVTSDRLWQGDIKFVAVYEQALTDAEVAQNFNAGVGTRTHLKFDIGLLVGMPGAYVQMEVQEFDAGSYLFKEPAVTMPFDGAFPLKNMRVAINGEVPVAGQVYKKLDLQVTEKEQTLSRLGMILPKDKGPEIDIFSLVFEKIGTQVNVEVAEEIVVPPIVGNDAMVQQSVGLKTFERINKSMSVLTGVPVSETDPAAVYSELKQQLPRDAELASFVSANQVGISKLGLEYCDAMVNSTALREAFFGSDFDFNADSTVAFASATDKLAIINPLYDKMVGTNLTNQPSRIDVANVVGGLIDQLLAPCGVDKVCDGARTQAIVKAACTTVLSSAAVTIQ